MIETLKALYEKAKPIFSAEQQEAANKVKIHLTGALPSYRAISYIGNNNAAILHENETKPKGFDSALDYYFKEKILNRHPSEHELFYNWRLATLPKWTKEIGNRAILELQSIFDVSPNFDTDNTRLRDYAKDNILKSIIKDANGYTAIRIISNNVITEALKIEYINFSYDEIVYNTNGVYAFRRGSVLFVYNKDYYYEYNGENKTIINQYQHSLGITPVIINGGILTDEKQGSYISFFDGFAEAANVLMRNASDDEAFQKLFYPRIIEHTEYCVPCSGSGQVTEDCDTGKCNVPCKSCSGTGVVKRGLGQVIQVKPRPQSDLRPHPNNIVEFVTPNVANNQHVFERFLSMYKACERSLYLNVTEDAQSGNAKEIDRENKSIFIKAILERVWIVANYIGQIELALLNYNQGHKISNKEALTRPVIFSVQSKSTLIAEYKEMQNANVPKFLKKKIIEKIAEIISPSDEVQKKTLKILAQINPLLFYTDSEVSDKQRMGRVESYELYVNEKADYILNNIIDNNGVEWFLEAEITQIITILNNELQKAYSTTNQGANSIPQVL